MSILWRVTGGGEQAAFVADLREGLAAREREVVPAPVRAVVDPEAVLASPDREDRLDGAVDEEAVAEHALVLLRIQQGVVGVEQAVLQEQRDVDDAVAVVLHRVAAGAGQVQVVLGRGVDEVGAGEPLVDVEPREIHEVVVVPERLAVLGQPRAEVLDVGEVVGP
jgi:hypothetical protein